MCVAESQSRIQLHHLGGQIAYLLQPQAQCGSERTSIRKQAGAPKQFQDNSCMKAVAPLRAVSSDVF